MHPLRCLTVLVALCTLSAGKKHRHVPKSHGHRNYYWSNFRNNRWGTNAAEHDLLPQFQTMSYPAYGTTVRYCGTSLGDPFEDRIVGGVEAIPHEFPWMAKLFHDRAFHCGAVLIADRYLLTAGHCVTSHLAGSSTEPRSRRGNLVNYEVKDPSEFIIEMGAHQLKEKSNNVVRRVVIRIILNPAYDVFSSSDIMVQTNDIAILEISPVQFTVNILPICLPIRNAKLRDHSQLVVAGWGSVLTETLASHTTKLPNALQKTVLTKISYDDCKNNRFVGSHLTATNQLSPREIFCMLGVHHDSCRGDSGGPAVMKTPQGYVVAGLVSWGLGCNQVNYPAAYTQVSSYMDFILANTRDGKFLPHKP